MRAVGFIIICTCSYTESHFFKLETDHVRIAVSHTRRINRRTCIMTTDPNSKLPLCASTSKPKFTRLMSFDMSLVCILRWSAATGAVSAAGIFQGNSCVNGKGFASAKALHWPRNPLEIDDRQADFEQICLCLSAKDEAAVQTAERPFHSAFMAVSDRRMHLVRISRFWDNTVPAPIGLAACEYRRQAFLIISVPYSLGNKFLIYFSTSTCYLVKIHEFSPIVMAHPTI